VGLYKTGLYGKVRHPQFTGILIITMGLTVMSSTLGGHASLQIVGLWLLQVLGYIAIAYYEERALTKKFSEEYKEYKRKVPFLFPIKSPKKIPELLFTLIIVIIICVILWLLPYDLIRIYSHTLYDTPWFW
jgi:steroid 5-alpha reductase family enzyme